MGFNSAFKGLNNTYVTYVTLHCTTVGDLVAIVRCWR